MIQSTLMDFLTAGFMLAVLLSFIALPIKQVFQWLSNNAHATCSRTSAEG